MPDAARPGSAAPMDSMGGWNTRKHRSPTSGHDSHRNRDDRMSVNLWWPGVRSAIFATGESMRQIAAAQSWTEQVYKMIRDSIFAGELTPCTHLVQENLANAPGVSRQPIQQDTLLLKNDGLVVEPGARGLYVASLDRGAVVHHDLIRILPDRLAARLVCHRVTDDPAFADELRRRAEPILSEGEASRHTGSAALTVAPDVHFHSVLHKMSGNPFLSYTAAPHWSYLRRMMVAVVPHAERGQIVWDRHRAIPDTLLTGDAGAAERLAVDHVSGAQKALLMSIADNAFQLGSPSESMS